MSKKSNKSIRKVSCSGCGRHPRFVGENVNEYFCNHCFLINGNYNRFKQGLPTFKPLTGIHIKDVCVGADGRSYKIVGKAGAIGEDRYYFAKRENEKDTVIIGDFFLVSKKG